MIRIRVRSHCHNDPFALPQLLQQKTDTMAFSMKPTTLFLVAALLLVAAEGFVPGSVPVATTALRAENNNDKSGGFFGAVSNFFEELDAFVDDATARRLGNGAAYYGKRKSSFYGEKDAMKKEDRDVADSSEDYMVQSGGNYKWITDENGQLRPVSRMKNTSVEKPLAFWGRKGGDKESEE
mmetsp:Transcript_3086/g.6842  ORF Transcript_3086/g.6842 Transcript_3086/m.6842 type:complete len:181 (+) Transcript_3086:187-729(+)